MQLVFWISMFDSAAVISFCRKWGAGLLVGTEAPLVSGLANNLVKAGIPTFGPSSEAAAYEGFKNIKQSFCDKDSIPTAKVLMVRLESHLAQVLLAGCRGELTGLTLDWSPGSAMVVVMASKGYPGSYEKDTVIKNLDDAEQVAPSVKIFHAGTAFDADGNFIATGGRVLGVTAKGKDLEEARDRAYQAVEEINWSGGFYR